MNTKKEVISLNELLLCILVVGLIFQRVVTEFVPQFSYFDEVVTAIIVVEYIFSVFKRKYIKKSDLINFGIILLIIFVGLVGNAISGYERSISTILSGILVWFKAFLVFICLNRVLEISFTTRRAIILLNRAVQIIVLAAFIGLPIGLITGWGMELSSARMRYGLHPYMFIYSQPALLSWYCLAFTMILTIGSQIPRFKHQNFKFLILNSIVWAFTLRSRAFVYIVIYWLMYILFFKINRKRIPKIKTRYIIILGIIALVVSWGALQKYFFSGTTNRSLLLITGISIALKYFPFGAGIANYATSASFKDYSKLYYDYGFNNIYRLNQSDDGMTELTDCYWPAVMGELGILGLIILAILLFRLGKMLLKESKKQKWIYMTSIFLIITSLFSSVATAIYSSDAMVLYVCIICLGCHMRGGDNDEISDDLVIQKTNE